MKRITQMEQAERLAAKAGTASLEEVVTRHFAGCRLADLPEASVAATKCLMLDTLGAILAAREVPDIVRLRDLMVRWGGSEATIVGRPGRIIAHHAALINGTMARTLEIDDVHETATLHATATILPVALAAMELRGGVSGAELLTAVAMGIDFAARISLSMQVDLGSADAPTRRMSYTYQTGILVGSLVAARILGMDADGIRNVLGVAYSQLAGNQQALFEGVSTVRVQQGLSGMTAVLSAQLAMAGVTGVRDSLEGEAGYFKAFHGGKFNRATLLDGLGRRFEVDNVSIKPYPCCKYTHTAIAAALEARQQDGFDSSGIDRVVAHVNHREYYEIVCKPEGSAGRRRELAGPDGRVRAQFCLAYVVAAALRDGAVELAHFEEACRSDEKLLALMDKVETKIDGGAPGRILPVPGIIDVYLKGRSEPIRVEAANAKGHPDNRMSYDEVAEKFMRVAKLRASEQTALRAVVDLVRDLPDVADGGAILRAVTL